MSLRVTSWNINSVRIRIPLIQQFIADANPDILCLQETKVEDDKFPALELQALGFEHLAFSGQKSYNGVAILSKIPLSNIQSHDLLSNGEKRHISATLASGMEVHNFYIPAGGDVPDVNENPKFKDKLSFVEAMTDWSHTQKKAQTPTVIVGDFNIAPEEHDVWSHKQLLKVVSHTPIEVEKLRTLQSSMGWVDSARHFIPLEEKSYSWWSYRNRDRHKANRGRRLDHIWTTPCLKEQLQGYSICDPARDWERPSDHIPITLDLAA